VQGSIQFVIPPRVAQTVLPARPQDVTLLHKGRFRLVSATESILKAIGKHEQLTRECRPLPQMQLNGAVKNIHDFQFEDFTLVGYDPHPAI
jgi:hypothetical protein